MTDNLGFGIKGSETKPTTKDKYPKFLKSIANFSLSSVANIVELNTDDSIKIECTKKESDKSKNPNIFQPSLAVFLSCQASKYNQNIEKKANAVSKFAAKCKFSQKNCNHINFVPPLTNSLYPKIPLSSL